LAAAYYCSFFKKIIFVREKFFITRIKVLASTVPALLLERVSTPPNGFAI
jgi:hypothetical protein